SRRLFATEIPHAFLGKYKAVTVENHVNMVKPTNGEPAVSASLISRLLNSQTVDRVFRCISGSVAVSAFEIENMPLPSAAQMEDIANLISSQSSVETIENKIESFYLGRG